MITELLKGVAGIPRPSMMTKLSNPSWFSGMASGSMRDRWGGGDAINLNRGNSSYEDDESD